MKIKIFLLSLLITFTFFLKTVYAVEEQYFNRCYLDNISKQQSASPHTSIQIKLSCASLLEQKLQQEIINELSNGSIQGNHLSFNNNSNYSITKVCIIVTNKYSKKSDEYCTSNYDWISNLLNWQINPSQIIGKETIPPKSSWGFTINLLNKNNDQDFWKSNEWRFSTIYGF